jgi:hypothetical protein
VLKEVVARTIVIFLKASRVENELRNITTEQDMNVTESGDFPTVLKRQKVGLCVREKSTNQINLTVSRESLVNANSPKLSLQDIKCGMENIAIRNMPYTNVFLHM